MWLIKFMFMFISTAYLPTVSQLASDRPGYSRRPTPNVGLTVVPMTPCTIWTCHNDTRSAVH